MTARSRLPAAVIGLGVFALLGLQVEALWPPPWWLSVGIAVAAATVFVEPFFTRPQDAIANALGGIGAFASADRVRVQMLWMGFLALIVVLLAAGVMSALLGGDGRLKWIGTRVARTLGRATVIGGLALLIEVVGRAARRDPDFEYLGLGAAVLLLSLTVDWAKVVGVARKGASYEQTIVAGIVGPSAFLLASEGDLEVGQHVNLRRVGREEAGLAGWVARKLPHGDGPRYEVIAEGGWDRVVRRLGEAIEVNRVAEPAARTWAAVLEGSDDSGINFQPASSLSIGEPVAIEVESDRALYQVTRIGLERRAWDGSASLVYSARARYIGSPNGERLVSKPRVPPPHAVIRGVDLPVVNLPMESVRLGVVKGTSFPIGLSLAPARRSHLAILGMSGMGKTSVAHRLAVSFGADSAVVTIDVTGEYATKFGCAAWDSSHLSTTGNWVWEPAGEPAKKAQEMVNAVMLAGHAEFTSGAAPFRRVIFLEEAHALIPEWNFAPRHVQDDINLTTRMVMQSRKLGLTFVIVSQRTAVVSKSALSQCENYIVLRTIDETSLAYLEAIVGPDFREAVAHLERYEALCVGPGFNSDGPVIVTLDPPT